MFKVIKAAQYVITSSQADVHDQSYYNNATPDYSMEHGHSRDVSLSMSASNSIISSPKSHFKTNEHRKNNF